MFSWSTNPTHFHLLSVKYQHLNSIEFFHNSKSSETFWECLSHFQPYEKNKKRSDYFFCLVPDVWVPEELLRSGGQVEFESEAKHIIHGTQEVQAALDLLLNLGSKTRCNRICIICLDMAACIIPGVIIDFIFVCCGTHKEDNRDKQLSLLFTVYHDWIIPVSQVLEYIVTKVLDRV